MKTLSQASDSIDFKLIDIGLIDANPWNPNVMQELEYEALKQDMRITGLRGVDAILVSPWDCFFVGEPANERYVIVDGEHRWRAAKELGWKQIRCEVRTITEDDAKALCYRRNRERGTIDPMKEALLFKTEIEKLKQKEIAEKYGIDQTTVSRRLSLLNLSDKTMKAVVSMPHGIITPSHLEPIATLSPNDQERVVDDIAKKFKHFKELPTVQSVEREASWLKRQAEEKRKLGEAVQKAKFPKCPKCGSPPSSIHYKGLPWVNCQSNEWRHEWNLQTGRSLYQEEHIAQRNLSGESEERVSRTLRCAHTVQDLHAIFTERMKELIPKLDKISDLKVSGTLDGAQFHMDLTGYGHSMAISTHHATTWMGFRAEEHDYKTGEKSSVQVNDPKEIELIKDFIDKAFQGSLELPVTAKKKEPSK
jgi:ParB/RepB/Spo0J family partition protein